MSTYQISIYDHAYNYAYLLPTFAWDILPSDYAAWYVRTYGEEPCTPGGCEAYNCAHVDHPIAYPLAVAELTR